MSQSPSFFIRIALLTLTLLAASVGTANAQFKPLTPAPAAELEVREKPHSAAIALAAPIAATAASVGLIALGDAKGLPGASTAGVVGLFLGPSLGHAYTGAWGEAALGTGIRLGGVGIALMSVPVILGTYSVEAGIPFIVGGGLAFAGGTIYSIVDAPFSAKRENKKRQYNLLPAPIQGPSKSTGWGAQLQMTF